MARRLRYTGAAVISADDVAAQCRVEADELQRDLVEQVIIPGVTAQAESKTGAAIREAQYEEQWPAEYLSGHALDIGQAHELIEVYQLDADGVETKLDPLPAHRLERGQRQTFLHFTAGRPVGPLRLCYRAGADLTVYPGVKSWLVMQAATAYEFRESLISGTILSELPKHFTDSLLAEIELPPRF